MNKYQYLFILSIILSLVNSARILAVFPTPSISHQVVFRPITQELAKRGHEVVVVTTDPSFPRGKAPENLIEIDVHDVSYEIWKEVFVRTESGVKSCSYDKIRAAYTGINDIFQKQMKNEEFKKILDDKTKKFDLLLLEAWPRQILILSHFYKCPVIQISSAGPFLGSYETMAGPIQPLLYPGSLRQRVHNLSLWEKLAELYTELQHQKLLYDLEEVENAMFKNIVGPDAPTVDELRNNIDLLMINAHSIWDNNRPVPGSVIYLGGLPYKPEKELPKVLKSFLDASKNGVIYVSFGTNVEPSLLPAETIQVLIKVFSKLPYDVLWKWDKDELPGKSRNVKIAKWFPQSDLLKHPKVKLFITQGGMQSTDESIIAGVPLIGIPMLGDQWYNAEKYVHHNIGIMIEMEDLSEELLLNSVNKIIEDPSYRANVSRLRSVLYDQPQNALERAVWWTEYVLRHGGAKHLRAPSANISYAEFLELRLLSVALVTVGGILILVGGILYRLCRCKRMKVKLH